MTCYLVQPRDRIFVKCRTYTVSQTYTFSKGVTADT